MNGNVVKVCGGIPLQGEVKISGSKHAALAILGVLPLLRGSVKLTNLPGIRDVEHMLKINESLGVISTEVGKGEYIFFTGEINFSSQELWRVPQLRSSILYLGSILLNCGHVLLPVPGGDQLGLRPLYEFLYVLDAFNIRHDLQNRGVMAYLDSLSGNREFDLCSKMFPLMGNNRSALAIMLAYANKGTTKMKNVIILPEIIQFCRFLQNISMGLVLMNGIGTDTLEISSPGLDTIHAKSCTDVNCTIAPDKCEIPFWICASALTRGNITLNVTGDDEVRRTMIEMKNALLDKAGIPLEVINSNQFRVDCSQNDFQLNPFELLSTQHELNGIAFDACPIFATLLFKAKGVGSFYCYRYGFERIRWAKQLFKIGASVYIKKNVLFVDGRNRLLAGKHVLLEGTDIRSSSSVLLIALATEGNPILVRGLKHIERGMEGVIPKLQSMGASIELYEQEFST